MAPFHLNSRRPLAPFRLALLLLVALALLATPLVVGRPVAAAPTADIDPTDLGVLTVIVGGLDSREPDQPENTDVLILARVDVPARTVHAVVIPRDLYVAIPGVGYDKITRAYDFGAKAAAGDPAAGIALVRATVAANFGIDADAVVLTTFAGFAAIVDALGGLDVTNPYDLYDAEYPTLDYGTKEIFYPAGPLHLDGAQALEFARTRHQDSDDGRTMRQQLLLRAMLDRAHDPALVPRLPRLVERTREAVRTDLDPAAQVALAVAAPAFRDADITFTSVTPQLWADYAPNGMWIYAADWATLPGYVEAVLDGTAS